MELDYEKDLEIDKFSLDAECMDQSRRFAKWGKLWSDAEKERDEIEARTAMDVRTNPEKYGLNKVSESGVESSVNSNQEVINIRHRVSVLRVAKNAFEQRRSMLEKMVDLFLSGYWAEPRLPKQSQEDLSQAGTEDQKQALKKRMSK